MSALYLTNDDVFTPRGSDKQITLQQGVWFLLISKAAAFYQQCP